ncbi:YncE family protein [Homoserinibacter sp. GY 40078]|uniref:YncE family protein n=1 Tax=Homoserinibacter sp. GY 40078 TaxID=2603275 RepID=UPI0011C7CB3D|nr:YncE family protein [Homoserinibacter sp. GY 40078]TXK17761.1 hypothetical protein FVQ89_13280 [Homoserinibacter sp. GY 40078]
MHLRRAVAALFVVVLAAAGVAVTPRAADAASFYFSGTTSLRDVVFSPDGDTAYLIDSSANKVLFVDVSTKEVMNSVSVNASPQEGAISADGSRLYVAHYNGSRPWTTVINTATAAVVTTVNDTSRGEEVPYTVELNPAGTQAWVGNYKYNAGSISVISTANNTVVKHIDIGAAVTSLAFSRDGAYAYATADGVGVYVISTSTYTKTLISLTTARRLAASPTQNKVYVAASTTLRVLDTTTNALTSDTSMTITISTSRIAFAADGSLAYVIGNSSSGQIEVFDTENDESAGVEPVPVSFATGISVDPGDSRHLLVVTGGSTLTETTIPRAFESAAVVTVDAEVIRPGTVLTATIDEEAEPTPTSYTYQWYVGEVAATGATSSTFTVPSSAIGKKITVTATPVLDGYVSATGAGTSSPTSEVKANKFSATPTPTITGTPTVDQTLTAVPGTWDSAATLSYAWYAGGEPIANATSSTFTVPAALVGSTITVKVTGKATGYETTTVESTGVGPVATAAFTRAPVVTLTGNARVGGTLTAVVSTAASPTPTSYSYRWLLDDEPITGATSTSLALTPGMLGGVVTVEVTPVRAGYTSSDAVGEVSSAEVAKGVFSAKPELRIDGTRAVGETLSVAVTSGSTPSATSYSYQWFTGDEPIDGATGSSLELTATHLGSTISVAVTPVREAYDGTTGTSRISTTTTIGAGSFTGDLAVSIEGTAAVAQTLTASVAGGVSPTPTGYTVQWYSDGIAIDGATSSEFTPSVEQLGTAITVTVSPVLAGYDAASGAATSDPTSTVEKGAYTAGVEVEVAGVAQVGQTLTATITSFAEPAPTAYVYQWYADGEPIEGATGASLDLTSELSGATITVVVTPQLDGYDSETGSGESVPTATVLTLTLSLSSAVAGKTVLVTGTGLEPGAVYTVVLHSDPVVLGTVTADSTGAFSRTFAIPAGTPAGLHHVVLVDEGGVDRATIALTISAAPAAADAGEDELGATGVDNAIPTAALALAVLLLGVLLVRTRRRTVRAAR